MLGYRRGRCAVVKILILNDKICKVPVKHLRVKAYCTSVISLKAETTCSYFMKMIIRVIEVSIGHFRVHFILFFKASRSPKSYENEFLFICRVKVITITNLLHLNSLWKRGWHELGNCPFMQLWGTKNESNSKQIQNCMWASPLADIRLILIGCKNSCLCYSLVL